MLLEMLITDSRTVLNNTNESLINYFDVIGLSREIVKDCFETSHCAIAGLEYSDIDERISEYHKCAFKEDGFNKIWITR